MLKKLIYLLLIFVFITSCFSDDALATTGNITGTVKISGTGDPLSDATISLSGESAQTTLSGSDGNFVFTELITGSYELSVSKSGYITNAKTVIVYPEKTASASFSLQKRVPVATPKKLELTREENEKSIELNNPQADIMTYTASTSKSWLSVNPSSGSIQPNNIELINIKADLTTISPGTYEETMVINVEGATLSIPVKVIYDKAPYITITKPQKDEEYKMGETMPITWDSNLNGKVKIDLLKASSIHLTIDSETLNEEGGSFNWIIPALDEEFYKLQLTSIENLNISFISETFKLKEGPTPPVVKTAIGASELGVSNIKVNGTITSLGIKATQVDQYGHVYSINNKIPTISDERTKYGITQDTLTYTSEITLLKSGETYYIRAYATNTKGSSYGDVITATTTSGAPVLSTYDAYEITENSAKSGGNITSDGGSTILERGLLYGKTEELNADSDKIIDSETKTGSYISSLVALSRGTKYYIKAYAKNSSGFGYSKIKFFHTIGDPPEVKTVSVDKVYGTRAEIKGKLTSNGGEPLNSYGFVYGTSLSPTIDDNVKEVGITDITDFSGEISKLNISTKYYVRAYATNARGTSYGENKTFTTTNGLPVMTTVSSEKVFGTNSVVNGNIDDNGGSSTKSYGFVYAQTSSPTIEGFKLEVGKVGLGEFNGKLTGLNVLTKYYVRAYATNSNGTGYGEDISFTTGDGLPSVNTVGSSEIQVGNAKLTGNIVGDGGTDLSSYGFVYDQNQNPTISGLKLEVGSKATGSYSGTISGLKTLTKYYFKSYATNANGTSYGTELFFTTKEGPFLSILKPALNQTLSPGETFAITWDTNITDQKITIEYWNEGAKVSEISNNTTISEKTYNWNVPSDAVKGSNHIIKIFHNSDNSKTYESSKFKIDNLTYIPDDKFEQYLINKGWDDVLDNYVITDNIDDIKDLSDSATRLKNLGIEDLTGIEGFKKLEFLDATNNKFTTVDLSKNTSLISLTLTDNLSLSNLKLAANSLSSPTKNDKLTTLQIDNTAITTLDTSKLSSLEFLNARFTSLSSVDFSNNLKLKYFFNYGTSSEKLNLNALNLSKNTELISLQIKNNGIGSLDLSDHYQNDLAVDVRGNPLNCIKVSDVMLNIYRTNWSSTIDLNQIISTDCSKARTNVPDDKFEQTLIDLGYDDLLDNFVVTANIKDLTSLTISNKEIQSLTGIEGFTSLKELYANNNSLGSDSNKTESFLSNTSLEVLSLWGNSLTHVDITKNTALKTLRLNKNSLWELDVSHLSGLTILDTEDNWDGSQYLERALRCIGVSQQQLDNTSSGWLKDAKTIYSLDCSFDGTYFTDKRDGNRYRTFGSASSDYGIWFAEPLRYNSTKSFNPKNDDNSKYSDVELYWADDTNAIPEGWHIPTEKEWHELLSKDTGDIRNGPGDDKNYNGATYKLKTVSISDWTHGCTGKSYPGLNNYLGFSAKSYNWRDTDKGATNCETDGSQWGVTWLSSTSEGTGDSKVYYTYSISLMIDEYYDKTIRSKKGVTSDYNYSGDQSKNISQGKYMIRLIKDGSSRVSD